MKENLKSAAVMTLMLIGFFLMVGAEGGIVQGTLAGSSGWWLMLTGLAMMATPVLVGVWRERKGDEDEEEDTVG